VDVDGEIPQAAEVSREQPGPQLTLAMTDATRATAVPKAVSRHEPWFDTDSEAWRCTVAIDV
jgi:hypothetical protein